MSLTAEAVKKEHPAVAAELAEEARVAERTRIASIREAALPGHEALVDQLIAEGVSAEVAGLRLLAAEKALRKDAAASRSADAPAALPNAAPNPAAEGKPKSREEIAASARKYAAEHKVDYLAALKAVGA